MTVFTGWRVGGGRVGGGSGWGGVSLCPHLSITAANYELMYVEDGGECFSQSELQVV